MSGMRKTKWGDEDDEELPETHDTKVDNNGFKIRTEYKINDRQQKLKITSKIRVIEEVCEFFVFQMYVVNLLTFKTSLATDVSCAHFLFIYLSLCLLFLLGCHFSHLKINK
jgi:hypothetical protein